MGKKGSSIAATRVENTSIYSILGQVVWQGPQRHKTTNGRKLCVFRCFGSKEAQKTLYFFVFCSHLLGIKLHVWKQEAKKTLYFAVFCSHLLGIKLHVWKQRS